MKTPHTEKHAALKRRLHGLRTEVNLLEGDPAVQRYKTWSDRLSAARKKRTRLLEVVHEKMGRLGIIAPLLNVDGMCRREYVSLTEMYDSMYNEYVSEFSLNTQLGARVARLRGLLHRENFDYLDYLAELLKRKATIELRKHELAYGPAGTHLLSHNLLEDSGSSSWFEDTDDEAQEDGDVPGQLTFPETTEYAGLRVELQKLLERRCRLRLMRLKGLDVHRLVQKKRAVRNLLEFKKVLKAMLRSASSLVRFAIEINRDLCRGRFSRTSRYSTDTFTHLSFLKTGMEKTYRRLRRVNGRLAEEYTGLKSQFNEIYYFYSFPNRQMLNDVLRRLKSYGVSGTEHVSDSELSSGSEP